MIHKITLKTVMALPTSAEKRYFVWDLALSRFGILVEKSGRHKWVVRYGDDKQAVIGKTDLPPSEWSI